MGRWGSREESASCLFQPLEPPARLDSWPVQHLQRQGHSVFSPSDSSSPPPRTSPPSGETLLMTGPALAISRHPPIGEDIRSKEGMEAAGGRGRPGVDQPWRGA